MNEHLNRRSFTKAAALAGVAAGATFTKGTAQDATPASTPVDQAMVDEIVNGWPDVPKEVANTVMQGYGPPHEATPSRLIWFNNSPWKRTIVYRDVIMHNFPVPHPDLLEQTIDYEVPEDKFDDLAEYDGSVIVERTKGEMSARCDKEGANFLALNLAHEIITDQRDVGDARDEYARAMSEFMANGTMDPYMQGFEFDLPTGQTADPDEEAAMGDGGGEDDAGEEVTDPDEDVDGETAPGDEVDDSGGDEENP